MCANYIKCLFWASVRRDDDGDGGKYYPDMVREGFVGRRWRSDVNELEHRPQYYMAKARGTCYPDRSLIQQGHKCQWASVQSYSWQKLFFLFIFFFIYHYNYIYWVFLIIFFFLPSHNGWTHCRKYHHQVIS